MPFGLRNASQTSLHFTGIFMRGFEFCCAYVDAILIASKTEEERIKHLEEVFRRLDLVVYSEGRAEICFRGHMVNTQGAWPLQVKLKALAYFPQPRIKDPLRRFLGMINIYHRFIANFAQVGASLTPLRRGPNSRIEMAN